VDRRQHAPVSGRSNVRRPAAANGSAGASCSTRSASTRAVSTNCGSFSVTSACIGVLVRSRRRQATSRFGALRSSSEAGGAMRFQKL
jgi:hypothetical protein